MFKIQRPLAAMFFDESKFLEQTLNIGPQRTCMTCEIILKSDQPFLTKIF